MRSNVEALIFAIEENRARMQKARERAETIQGKLKSPEATVKEIRDRHQVRKCSS